MKDEIKNLKTEIKNLKEQLRLSTELNKAYNIIITNQNKNYIPYAPYTPVYPIPYAPYTPVYPIPYAPYTPVYPIYPTYCTTTTLTKGE